MKSRPASQQLVSEVQMLRIRVAAAESKLKVMREQAREAKRRRKEAKRNAQLVRKRCKQSKADLSELREALASAEAKLYQAGGRALARKASQAKRTALNRIRKVATTKAAPPSRRSPALGPRPVRTLAKRQTIGSRKVSMATPLDAVPVSTAIKPALSSLPTSNAGEPVTNATSEPMRHILNLIPYKQVPREKIKLPKRSMKGAYDDQASLKGRKFVPEKY